MQTLVASCPHCNAIHIALSVVSTIVESDFRGIVYLQCPHCRKPACAAIVSENPNLTLAQATKHNGSLNSHGYKISHMWPETRKPQVPDSLPEGVSRAMLQAESNFQLPGHEEAASVMYRKALELGLKSLGLDLKGTLANRIERLSGNGQLTPQLAEWAKEIKNLGNDGAHEVDAIDREELAQLRGLTDMVLQYLFTLPAIVNARRKAEAKDKVEA